MENLQKKVKEFVEKHQLEQKVEISALDLVSEIGEVTKEILKSSEYGRKEPKYREELKEELGDVFYSLINLANHYQVDLEEALVIAVEKYERRIKEKGEADS